MAGRTREVGALGASLKTFSYPGGYKSVSPYNAISLLKMALGKQLHVQPPDRQGPTGSTQIIYMNWI